MSLTNPVKRLIDWLIERLSDWWLIDWLTQWLIGWWSSDGLIDRLADWWLIDWLVGQPVNTRAHRSNYPINHKLIDWLMLPWHYWLINVDWLNSCMLIIDDYWWLIELLTESLIDCLMTIWCWLINQLIVYNQANDEPLLKRTNRSWLIDWW